MPTFLLLLLSLSFILGVSLVVVAVVFVAKNIGTTGATRLKVPFPGVQGGLVLENASTAVVVLIVGAIFAAGPAVLAYLAYSSTGPQDNPRERKIASVRFGTVTEIEDKPTPDSVAAAGGKRPWELKWLNQWFEAQITVDLGSSRGPKVKGGDFFAVIRDEKKLANLPKEDIANLQDESLTLIKAVRVYPDSSTAMLWEWAYVAALDEIPRDATKEEFMKMAAPVNVGDSLVRIPSEEAKAWDEIAAMESQALEEGTTEAEKQFLYGEIVDKAENFLLDYGDGFFAADVLFVEGRSQFCLGKYEDAADTFTRFTERFPFHPSASAASNWLEKAEKRSHVKNCQYTRTIGRPCTGCFSSALLTRNNKLFLPKGTSARIPTSENAHSRHFGE